MIHDYALDRTSLNQYAYDEWYGQIDTGARRNDMCLLITAYLLSSKNFDFISSKYLLRHGGNTENACAGHHYECVRYFAIYGRANLLGLFQDNSVCSSWTLLHLLSVVKKIQNRSFWSGHRKDEPLLFPFLKWKGNVKIIQLGAIYSDHHSNNVSEVSIMGSLTLVRLPWRQRASHGELFWRSFASVWEDHGCSSLSWFV